MASSTRIEALLLSLTLCSSAVYAQPVEQQAKAQALEGKKAFDTGQFADAITHYSAAYKLKPAPGLLFNLAQSHRRLAHFDEALSYFRRYLETNPPKAQAAAVEKLVAQVEAEKQAAEEKARVEAAQLAEREAAAQRQRQQEAAEAQRLKLEAARAEAARAEEDAARRKLELEQALKAKAEASPPITTRWWFWTAVGAVVAGGVTVGVIAAQPQPTPTTWPDIDAR